MQNCSTKLNYFILCSTFIDKKISCKYKNVRFHATPVVDKYFEYKNFMGSAFEVDKNGGSIFRLARGRNYGAVAVFPNGSLKSLKGPFGPNGSPLGPLFL